MKTVNIEVYSITELSEQAQEVAHSNHLENFDHFWLDDSMNSVSKFADLFYCKVTDYSIGGQFDYIETDIDNDCIRGIKPADIPLDFLDGSGYCLDSDILETFHSSVKVTGDVKTAFNEAVDVAVKHIVADLEYHASMECFTEMSNDNDWQYLENGTLF